MEKKHHSLVNLKFIEEKLGAVFHDKRLLELAFVHRSFVNENKGIKEHNERLEFLGDSILGLIVSEFLFKNLPLTREGELSFLRSRLVEAKSCAHYVQKLGVGEFILLGKGEKLNEGKGRLSIQADLFEAIMGALFLDGGFEACKKFFFSHFMDEVDKILKMPLQNWKAILQDLSQKTFQEMPVYNVLEATGPDHKKSFKVAVLIKNKTLGEGMGSSKKEAEQQAASEALKKLKPELF